jgi:hypothetical protein
MSESIAKILDQLNALIAASTRVDEQSYSITIEGNLLDINLISVIKSIINLTIEISLESPNVFVNDDRIDFQDEDEEEFLLGQPWRFVFAKTSLSKLLKARESESTFLFISLTGFYKWLERLDPFVKSSEFDPDFSGPVTFRVQGLKHSFGGPLLWVLPIDAEPPEIGKSNLPESSDVRGLIHINTDQAVNIYPSGFALTWGNIEAPEAQSLRYLSAMVLSACLVQEIKHIDGTIEIIIKGTKRIALPLTDSTETPSAIFLGNLVEAVRWVYAEKPETRIKLLMDRLSIDIKLDQTFLKSMEFFLNDAINQAKDSYDFVILDRKDAYYKELREIMKDMKSQADLFASKIRDLVSSLARDILGILFAIGFTFFGKFDPTKLNELLVSTHLALFLKLLSGYLIFSFILQLSVHWTDVKLSESESKKWLSVLRNYTTKTDNNDYFLKPIIKRKRSLCIALIITGIIYLLSAFMVWNLQCIVRSLILQD